MCNSATISKEKTNNVIKFPHADKSMEQQRQPIVFEININQGSGTAPVQLQQEAGNTMVYSLANKILPRKDAVDLIINTLDTEEKEEFLQELLIASVRVVSTGKTEYIEALRQLIAAWEYTAEIEADPEFAKKLDNIREEIENDQSPGVDWRELLRG